LGFDHAFDYRIAKYNGVLSIRPPGRPIRRRRRILLIHGFNADEKVVDKGYRRFRENLATVASGLDVEIKTLQWPGRFLYGNAVRHVNAIYANILADFLARSARGQIQELVLVAHSMGCRLVIEALERLDPADSAVVLPKIRLFLMAAAVPTRLLQIGTGHRAVVAACAHSEVLYSPHDEALGAVFSIGQLAEKLGWDEAVGLHGRPKALWGVRAHHMRYYLHGAYWSHELAPYRLALSLREATSRPPLRAMIKSHEHAYRSVGVRALRQRDVASRRLDI
jgi:pimeloyl-ACP methyl ester carboxylesterase